MNTSFESIIPMLRRFAYSLTGNQHDADDLVQATFEKILKKGMPDDIEPLKWAFKVCRNLWIDEYRSAKVRLKAVQTPELQEQADESQAPQKDANEQLVVVNQAMQSLPDDQRTILSLVALKGLSYKEVAEISQIPVGTVMSRLSRARASLLNIVNMPSAGETS